MYVPPIRRPLLPPTSGPPSGYTVDAVDDTPQGESQNDCTYAQTKQIDPPSTHNHYSEVRAAEAGDTGNGHDTLRTCAMRERFFCFLCARTHA